MQHDAETRAAFLPSSKGILEMRHNKFTNPEESIDSNFEIVP